MAHGKHGKDKAYHLDGKRIHLDRLDQKKRFASREDYDTRLEKAQTAMLRVQEAYFHEKRRALLVFEGWDAAGKGGAIRRLTEHLDPRGCKVWPIAAPKPEEQGRHYLYRFWQRLPEPGTIAVFDRSWYGRVLVERVEGFAKKRAWKRAYHEINEFERMLAEDGVRIVKMFLHITDEEQLERFVERLRNPYKRWKLSTEDLRNRARRKDYVEAIEDMFEHTSTEFAPWHAIAANHKWQARVHVIETVVEALSAGVKVTPPPLDPQVQAQAAVALGISPLAVMNDGDKASQSWSKPGRKGKDKKTAPTKKKKLDEAEAKDVT
jgi:PPK2 family polyphosphate:nucleotide phosphotransferase